MNDTPFLHLTKYYDYSAHVFSPPGERNQERATMKRATLTFKAKNEPQKKKKIIIHHIALSYIMFLMF
jgi:hypothetical protein